jgi:hypothetical protein
VADVPGTMNSLFGRVVLTANVIAGVVSVSTTLISILFAWHHRRHVLARSEETRFQDLLEASDLRALGGYLDDTLGGFSVRDYAADSIIAARFDRLLGRLESFVDLRHDGDSALPREEKADAVMAPAGISEVGNAWRDIERGELWNGLAKLRRYIELTLRDFLARNDIPVGELRSAGQMVRLAERRRLLSPEIATDLRYAIDVANRAIHGSDISDDQAREATFVAERALQRMGTQAVEVPPPG